MGGPLRGRVAEGLGVFSKDDGSRLDLVEVPACAAGTNNTKKNRKGTHPRGSKYRMFQASGSKNHSQDGLSDQKPQMLRTWIL